MRLLILAAAFAASALTAGCGFAPIHARPSGGLTPLANIRVDSLDETRADFIFEQVMSDKLGAYSPSGDYTLETRLTQRRLGFGIRVDDVATRYESTVTANYRLLDATGVEIFRGRRDGVASYDVTDDPYSELAAEQRSTERAIEVVAEKVRLDLTLFFADAAQDS